MLHSAMRDNQNFFTCIVLLDFFDDAVHSFEELRGALTVKWNLAIKVKRFVPRFLINAATVTLTQLIQHHHWQAKLLVDDFCRFDRPLIWRCQDHIKGLALEILSSFFHLTFASIVKWRIILACQFAAVCHNYICIGLAMTHKTDFGRSHITSRILTKRANFRQRGIHRVHIVKPGANLPDILDDEIGRVIFLELFLVFKRIVQLRKWH